MYIELYRCASLQRIVNFIPTNQSQISSATSFCDLETHKCVLINLTWSTCILARHENDKRRLLQPSTALNRKEAVKISILALTNLLLRYRLRSASDTTKMARWYRTLASECPHSTPKFYRDSPHSDNGVCLSSPLSQRRQ